MPPFPDPPLALRRIRAWTRGLPRTRAGVFLPKLIRALPNARIALVGGAVRDVALGRIPKDIDVVVSGAPLPVIERALRVSGRVDVVGRRFGVLKWQPRGAELPEPIDIALPRRDHAFGTGGYRDVSVQSDPRIPIEADLARRDFTVNALAWDLAKGTLLDPSGGVGDLRRGRIRAVGDPARRFREDRGRILRAARFSAQLGFRMESRTLAAVRAAAPRLNEVRTVRGVRVRVVPNEVIAKELVKTLLADPVRGLDLLDASGILPSVLPEVVAMKRVPQPRQFHAEGDVYQHTRLALSFLRSPGFRRHFLSLEPTPTLVIAVLLHDIGKPRTLRTPAKHGTDRIRFNGHDAVGAVMARTVAERLKLTNAGVDAERLKRLVARHLIFTERTIAAMRLTKIEALFLGDPVFGRELLALKYCDGAATVDPNGRHTLNSLYQMERRIRSITPKGTPLPRIVSGHDLMRTLRLGPGPQIGRMLEAIREGQLDGTVRTRAQAIQLARQVHAEA